MKQKAKLLLVFLFFALGSAFADVPFALLPVPRSCFTDSTGAPLAGGNLFFYAAGTTNQQATYTDYLGAAENTNPLVLDAHGCGLVFLAPLTYDVKLTDANGAELWTTYGVSDVGQLLYTKAVLLDPTGGALQTISGPLAAYVFNQTAQHVSSNLRVNMLDPSTLVDTATNPPTIVTLAGAGPGLHYKIPTIPSHGNFVMNPDPTDAGLNILDCSATGITCKRTAYVYFEGAGCNNLTSAMGWDTFGTNSPSPVCLTGTNIQKGLLSFPAAVSYVQENSVACPAAGTCAITYPLATTAGNLLEVEVVVDATKTVTGCTDGTNAYTLAIAKAQGVVNVSIWYRAATSTAMPAGTTLTCTFSAGTPNSAMDFKEYSGVVTGDSLDKTASNGNAGSTTVTTGTTVGTSQATELVLAAVGTTGAAAITGQNGWTKHAFAAQSTNVSVVSQGTIQQTTTTQASVFTIASSELWASVIATFKANVAGNISAQRQWFTPSFFTTAFRPVEAAWLWQAPLAAVGTVNVSLGAQIVCTAPGSTDDPSYLTATTAIAPVSATGANIMTYTPLTPLTSTGCSALNALHLQIFRQRYNVNDTFEGPVLLNGAPLFYGITQ